MIEVKVSFDSVGEMLDFFGGKAGNAGNAGNAGSVQQVAQEQKVMAEPATPAAQPIAPQPPQPAAQPITAAPQPQPQQPQQPAAQPITAAPQQPQQQPAKQYTKDEIARACAPLANDPESMRMLQELLASYNAVSLHDLDKSQYPDFADKLRNLGVSV